MGVAKTAMLLASLTALLGLVGMALDKFMGTGGLMTVVFLGFGIVTNWVSYFYSDKIVLKMYKAREVSPQEAPQLHEMVDRLAARMQLPKPKVCIVPTDVPNAFATGRNPAHGVVAVTEGIMRALNREELEGVVAHELAHIRHRDTLTSTVAASIAGAIAMLANIGQFGMMFGGGSRDEEGGGNPLIMLIMVIAAPMVAMIVQMAISRTREFGADRAAVEATGNPDAMASALQRIESFARNYQMPATQGTQHMFIINPLTGRGMTELFSTHPPTEKRIAAIMRLRGAAMPPPLPRRP